MENVVVAELAQHVLRVEREQTMWVGRERTAGGATKYGKSRGAEGGAESSERRSGAERILETAGETVASIGFARERKKERERDIERERGIERERDGERERDRKSERTRQKRDG